MSVSPASSPPSLLALLVMPVEVDGCWSTSRFASATKRPAFRVRTSSFSSLEMLVTASLRSLKDAKKPDLFAVSPVTVSVCGSSGLSRLAGDELTDLQQE